MPKAEHYKFAKWNWGLVALAATAVLMVSGYLDGNRPLEECGGLSRTEVAMDAMSPLTQGCLGILISASILYLVAFFLQHLSEVGETDA